MAVCLYCAVLMITGLGWARAAPLRYLSYAIDTVLLIAALTLVIITRQYPLVHAWITVKVLLIVVYIMLGYFALNVKTPRRTRVICRVTVLAVFGFVVSIARTHHPLGIFAES